ncbi:glyoxal reductase [Pedobacter glucosidilyticus]|nr:aldo/keto reductase [Pedobacter glucosidilyticus]KHJ38850.1 glyoxal reductase [Pedobacter glucosidilyticus]
MNKMKEEQENQIQRRAFIQKSALFAASTLILPFLSEDTYGFVNPPQKSKLVPNVKLNNGVLMPVLGFGTFQLRESVCQQSVADAISVGYRLIDTATLYKNEEFVGAGIKDSGIKREELFITSKVWVTDSGYEKSKIAFETSLKKLGTDYLDLYLIHRPRGDFKGSWKMMEELYKEGRIRAIGLSNFTPAQYDDFMKEAKIIPTVNQVESHAYFHQIDTYKDSKENKVQMEAYTPFAQGRNGLFTNPVLAEIGKKYNKTNAQVSLRWHYQRGVVAIPRSSKKEHIIENFNIFDFKLSKADMATIAYLDLNKTQFPTWG